MHLEFMEGMLNFFGIENVTARIATEMLKSPKKWINIRKGDIQNLTLVQECKDMKYSGYVMDTSEQIVNTVGMKSLALVPVTLDLHDVENH